MPHKFRELAVWRRAMDLVSQVYGLTHAFPQHEIFGLTSQLRRAAISIPLNIAEGAGSESSNEFRRFLSVALRSAYETMAAMEIAVRLRYCDPRKIHSLMEEADHIAAMIVRLAESMKAGRKTRSAAS